MDPFQVIDVRAPKKAAARAVVRLQRTIPDLSYVNQTG